MLLFFADLICGTGFVPLWLPRSCHALLCLHQSWDDLLWDPPHWSDERPRTCSLSYILYVLFEDRWFMGNMVYSVKKKIEYVLNADCG